MVEIVIRPIAPRETRLLNSAFALYRDSIARSEQRPEAEFKSLVGRTDYRFLAAMFGDELVGFTVSWVPADSDFWLLEYAGVLAAARGRRIGENLFTGARLVAGETRTALTEVEVDLGGPDQARRLGFYRRQGWQRVVGLDYRLPLRAFGIPPPMWLLVMPPKRTDSLSAQTVEGWLRRIYAEAYGKDLDDPRLAQMVDPLPDSVMLEPILGGD